MSISDLQWTVGAESLSWVVDGVRISHEYDKPLRSAVTLRDGSGVAVVEPLMSYGESNAVILNADGSLRFRLRMQANDGTVYGFDQMYYVDGELTAIFAVTGRDFAYVVDEANGTYIRHYETR